MNPCLLHLKYCIVYQSAFSQRIQETCRQPWTVAHTFRVSRVLPDARGFKPETLSKRHYHLSQSAIREPYKSIQTYTNICLIFGRSPNTAARCFVFPGYLGSCDARLQAWALDSIYHPYTEQITQPKTLIPTNLAFASIWHHNPYGAKLLSFSPKPEPQNEVLPRPGM